MDKSEYKQFLFPFDEVRDIQEDMIKDVANAIENRKHLIAHAPTGLGKTVSVLAPALKYVLGKGKDDEQIRNKKIFFLTSRHTQHKIAIETLKAIKQKYKLNPKDFLCVDIVGKKWMCNVPGVEYLYSNEFTEYCKKQREENKCEFYSNTKKGLKLSPVAKVVLKTITDASPIEVKEMQQFCEDDKLCSYEVAIALAKEAKVIVGDYYYIFNPIIREMFFKKCDIDLNDCIIVVDEGHNLPTRIRDLLSKNLTTNILKNAIKEAKKFGFSDAIEKLNIVSNAMNNLAYQLETGQEKLLSKEKFFELIQKNINYDELVEELSDYAKAIRETEKSSSIGTVANFLEAWPGPDDGFVRVISIKKGKSGPVTLISYKCLDPSLITEEIIENSHSTIIMSGTLSPTAMYREILGFPKHRTIEKEFPNPFPDENKLTMIIPKTTTKYSLRNEKQFNEIAKISADVVNAVNGNSAVFFPSYIVRDSVNRFFEQFCNKTTFLELPEMTKQDKEDLLNRFKSYKDSGAVLLGVANANYAEGIDLPGDLLKCVVVVGLPLQKPDIETKSLIEYYNKKFGKGWEYGYILPGFQKSLQSAGRCIRSETDKGIIVFLDERYTWPNYYRCFPRDARIRITNKYVERIEEFFRKK